MVEAKGPTALIKAQRTTSCDSCASKKVCHGVTETDMVIEVLNPVNAKAGDEVVFTVGAATVLKAGVFAYLVPLIGFIAGVVIGQMAAEKVFPGRDADLVSAALGFAFLAVTFFGIYLYGKKAKKGSYMPTIVKIV